MGQAVSIPAPIQVYRGKISKKGPLAISVPLNFTGTVQTFTVDLNIPELQGSFDALETIYVDNILNAQPVLITCSVTGQNLIVPANSMAYLPVVQPVPSTFDIFSTGGVLVTLQLLNYPIDPAVWSSTGGGGGGGNVVIIGPLGQQPMAQSVSVVIASDQTPISITGTVSIIGGAIISQATATGLPPQADENTTVNLSEDLNGNLRVVPYDLDNYRRRIIETQQIEEYDLASIGRFKRHNERFTPIDRRGGRGKGSTK